SSCDIRRRKRVSSSSKSTRRSSGRRPGSRRRASLSQNRNGKCRRIGVIVRSGDRATELPLPTWDVPRLGPTDRLVGLPPMRLTDAFDGGTPRLTTAVRVGARGGALLVRFDGRDRGVVATLTKRDDPLWKEDVFEVFLSPGDRPAVYYEFEVNPLGALFDARIESPDGHRDTMHADVSWNCLGFSARVRR